MSEKATSTDPAITPPSEKKKKVTGRERYARSRVIIGVVLIIAAIVIGILVVGIIAPKNSKTNVLVAKTDIPAGVVFTQENLLEYFVVREETDTAIAKQCVSETQANQLVGMCLRESVTSGTDILRSNIMSAESVGAEGPVPAGKQIAGVKIPPAYAEAGYAIKAGDIVTFYGTTDRIEGYTFDYYIDSFGNVREADVAHTFVYDLLTYVKVYGIYDENGIEISGTHEVIPATMNVICTTEQAKQIAGMQRSNGQSEGGGYKYYITLASTGDRVREDELLAKQDEILARYDTYKTMYAEIEKTDVYYPMNVFSAGGYVPVAGDAVIIRYTSESKAEYIGSDGKAAAKDIVTLSGADMLACVRLTNVYNDKGVTTALNKPGEVSETIGGITLNLSKEQVALIDSLRKEGKLLFISKNDTPDELIDAQYEAVDAAIRRSVFGDSIPSFEPVYPMPVVEEPQID